MDSDKLAKKKFGYLAPIEKKANNECVCPASKFVQRAQKIKRWYRKMQNAALGYQESEKKKFRVG